MIIAAHQPNYAPWLGFFHKLARCDRFLILDHCQFERQGFENRVKIRRDEGWKWLTVPVMQKSRDERILDKEIAYDRDGRLAWSRKHYLTLEQVYGRAPHFKTYAPQLREIYETHWDKLVDFNLTLLAFCMKALEMRTPVLRTSQMGEIPGQKSQLVLNMCKAAGAAVYLSGSGASKEYLDLPAFAAEGVEVRFQEFKHPEYPQGHAAFVPGLSVLDLLFNCGPASRAVLEGLALDSVPAPALSALEARPLPHVPALVVPLPPSGTPQTPGQGIAAGPA